MGTNSGTTHIRTVLIFSPDIDKHFTSNAPCNSGDSVTRIIHILHFFMINNAFYSPPPPEEEMEDKVIGLVFFEEPAVTGNTFPAMMENTALRRVPVGTVFQSDGAPPHFFRRVRAFPDREFPFR
jgi:hypothetical protein